MLPRKLVKKPKRSTRWRSQKHCNFVRGHACSACGSDIAIEVAHVRIGSGAGMGQKPDDWRTVSLCKECHQLQHNKGERTFWAQASVDVEAMIDAFCKSSPASYEIEARRLLLEAERGYIKWQIGSDK